MKLKFISGLALLAASTLVAQDAIPSVIITPGQHLTHSGGVYHFDGPIFRISDIPVPQHGVYADVDISNTKLTSNENIFLQAFDTGVPYGIAIEANEGSIITGRIDVDVDIDFMTFVIFYESTWITSGSSKFGKDSGMGVIIFTENAVMDYTLTDTSDSIYVGGADGLAVSFDSTATLKMTLSNEFLSQIYDGYEINIDEVVMKSFSKEGEFSAYNLTDDQVDFRTINANGSTWTATNVGTGIYRITDINIILEPATYAAIFCGTQHLQVLCSAEKDNSIRFNSKAHPI